MKEEDVPFSLCNPRTARRRRDRHDLLRRKALRGTIRRSWEDPYAAHSAIDELAIDALLRRMYRNNPPRRIPASDVARVRRWYKALSRTKRQQVIRSVLGRMNPPKKARRFKAPSTRDWRGFMSVKRAMKANPRHGERAAQRRRKACHRGVEGRSFWPDTVGRVEKRYRRRAERRLALREDRWDRRNPKLDGSPTRGEKRKAKKVEYLRSLIARGKDASAMIESLIGSVPADPYKALGKRAERKVQIDHARAWKAKHDAELAEKHAQEIGDEQGVADAQAALADAPKAPEVAPEVRAALSRIHDLDVLIDGYQQELKEIGDDDTMEDEAARLQEEVIKLAKQRTVLRKKVEALQPAQESATNPRRRGRRRARRARVRLSPRQARRLRVAAARAGRAVRQLISFMRRSRALLRRAR